MMQRKKLTTFGLALTAVVLLAGASFSNSKRGQKPPRPNIILILADDMGFSDLGSYGGEIATPNLDRLAREGLRFTHFYNNTRCSPSRAALLTGLYSHQTGVAETPDSTNIPEGYLRHLSDRSVTIAEALRAEGYHTLMSGKWHLGMERPHWPVDHGFERSFALIDCCSNYFGREEYHLNGKNRPWRALIVNNDRPVAPPGDNFYITDAFGERAAEFVAEYARKDEPFFLYLAFTAPHWPLHALPEDIAKYKGKFMEGWDKLRERRYRRLIELGIIDRKWPLSPRDGFTPAWESLSAEEKEKWDHLMAVYAAQIDRLDQNVGKLLARLKETGEEENTLIFFLSDNGASAEHINRNRGEQGAPAGARESYRSYGLPWANLSATPFRLYKQWVHEGGIVTPMIARWPRGIKQANKLFHQPAHLIDIMATCLEVAGAKYPKTFQEREIIPLEGRSLVPAFEGKNAPIHKELYWEHRGSRAVRQGKWKLVAQNPGAWELYDMKADRTELNNLAAKYPRKVKELSALYDAWAKRSGVVPYPFPPHLLKRPGPKFPF